MTDPSTLDSDGVKGAAYPEVAARTAALSAEDAADWRLLAEVAAGRTASFERLVERHQDRLLALCERMLLEREAARDAVQEVFLKTYRQAGRIRPRGRLYTWLYRVAVNHCLNRIRRRRLVRFLPLEPDPGGAATAAIEPRASGADPEADAAARERWRSTRRAIESLPASQRTVVVLARFEGLRYRQIGEILGISEGAVESRLFRALRRLERELEKESGPASPRAQETEE